MIASYERYSRGKYTLTLEQMQEIHTIILQELTDVDARELYANFAPTV